MLTSLKKIFLSLVFPVFAVFGLALIAGALPAQQAAAQSGAAVPSLPAPLQSMVDQGAQIKYLGNHGGLDGWIMIKNGREQFFYVLPGGQGFLLGVMFDNEGKIVTAEQVKELRESSEGGFLDLVESNPQTPEVAAQERMEFKTPSEQLLYAVENSNWIGIGNENAPAIYSFIDPQCPHCHSFINDMRPAISRGDVQIRAIPVGFREDTRAQAAFLLAMPDPAQRLFRHLDGDSNALPVLEEINQQGVQRNLSVMQTWKLNVTPLTVYRAASGQVKILQGRARDTAAILQDIK